MINFINVALLNSIYFCYLINTYFNLLSELSKYVKNLLLKSSPYRSIHFSEVLQKVCKVQKLPNNKKLSNEHLPKVSFAKFQTLHKTFHRNFLKVSFDKHLIMICQLGKKLEDQQFILIFHY